MEIVVVGLVAVVAVLGVAVILLWICIGQLEFKLAKTREILRDHLSSTRLVFGYGPREVPCDDVEALLPWEKLTSIEVTANRPKTL